MQVPKQNQLLCTGSGFICQLLAEFFSAKSSQNRLYICLSLCTIVVTPPMNCYTVLTHLIVRILNMFST